MHLGGPWRVAVSNPELERLGGDPDLDDGHWPEVPVPGHWNEAPALAGSYGPVLYRRRFSAPAPTPGDRWWLVLEGVLTQGDVWLDGSYLGDTEGYFVAHRFEVTEHLAAGTDHLLAVGVACPPPAQGRAKRDLTGSLQAGPLRPPGHPGGIWRPVHLHRTGPVAIRHSRLLCTAATTARADLGLRLVVLAAGAVDAEVETTIVDPDGSVVHRQVEQRPLAAGENRLELAASVAEPRRWWPAGLGAQDRYGVTVRLLVAGVESDQRQWVTGLRTVSVDDFTFRVNGERLFCKGIAVGPPSWRMGSSDGDLVAGDLRAARDAGFDLVRVHGHVARPELYEAADQLGLLVWQDLPLVGGYSTGTRARARRLAREAVDLLGHHPSVALWCGHDEPNGPPVPSPAPGGTASVGRTARRLARHLAPSWNRSVLDPQLRRELRGSDPTRSVVTSAGMLPHPVRLSGSDTHLWLGWRAGRADDLATVLRRWPRLGRFVAAFGTQSAGMGSSPEPAPPAGPERSSFERYVPPSAHRSAAAWAEATRRYQAEVLRTSIEVLRKLKYRPAGGFCAFALVDADPMVGYGLLDADRRPKPAYAAVVDACRPVIVVADPPPDEVTTGQPLDLAVHVVSDLRTPLEEVRVTARVSAGGPVSTRAWVGPVAADACCYVGRLRAEVPDGPGPLWIDLDLVGDGVVATNRYRSEVRPTAGVVRQQRTPTGT